MWAYMMNYNQEMLHSLSKSESIHQLFPTSLQRAQKTWGKSRRTERHSSTPSDIQVLAQVKSNGMLKAKNKTRELKESLPSQPGYIEPSTTTRQQPPNNGKRKRMLTGSSLSIRNSPPKCEDRVARHRKISQVGER